MFFIKYTAQIEARPDNRPRLQAAAVQRQDYTSDQAVPRSAMGSAIFGRTTGRSQLVREVHNINA